MPKKDSTKAQNDNPAGKETPKFDDPNYEQIMFNRLSFERIQQLAVEFANQLEKQGEEAVDLFLLLMQANQDCADDTTIYYMTRAAYAVSQDCNASEGRYLNALKQRFFKIGGVS